MGTTSIIGRLLAPWNVEQTVLGTLTAWLDLYLHDLERQNDLAAGTIPRPPAPESLIGGTDFESWQEDLLPMLIVVVNPAGNPEINRPDGYSQAYQVDIAAVLTAADERTARMYAGLYAAAAMGVIIQPHGPLDELANHTTLTGAPSVALPDPEIRRLARGQCSFSIIVDGIANDDDGPIDPLPQQDPSIPPRDAPQVTEVDITITGRPPIDSDS